jgi:hypothetical protein
MTGRRVGIGGVVGGEVASNRLGLCLREHGDTKLRATTTPHTPTEPSS